MSFFNEDYANTKFNCILPTMTYQSKDIPYYVSVNDPTSGNNPNFSTIMVSSTVTAKNVLASGFISTPICHASNVLANTETVSSLTVSSINSALLESPLRTILGNYSGTATGTSAIGYLTSSGQSNIAVIPGATYILTSPSMSVDAVVSGSDYGFTFAINNSSTDTLILESSTSHYKSGAILNLVPQSVGGFPFIAQSSNVQLYIANSSGASALSATQVNLINPQLTRIR